ncbi:MAG: TonB family protein [Muribaculaceae bacterium]|nr:TonB family protein [Muribaculaceae bacterium]
MKTKIVLITLLLAAFMASTASARVPRKNPTEFDKGTTAYDKQQYQQAIDWMDKVLDQNPDNGYALAYKGSSLRYLKRLDEAVTTLDRAATLIDDVNTAFRAWTNSERFYALVDQGDTIAALQAIDLAIQDDGNNPVYWTNRAVIKAGQGNLDEAIADYDKAIALSPNDANLLEMRQRAFDHNEKYKAAVAANGEEYTEHIITDKDEVVLPQFPGGTDALREYIYKKTGWNSTKSPVSVMVDVTIDKQGKVIDTAIKQGYNKKLDSKALKICRKLPKFIPATHHGEPVESTLTIPVRFPKPNN